MASNFVGRDESAKIEFHAFARMNIKFVISSLKMQYLAVLQKWFDGLY